MTNHSNVQPTVTMSKQKTKRGFTLTEIAIVLGIIGLILGAVWSAAKNVYANTNQSKGQQIASILVANVRGSYAQSQPTTGNLSSAFSGVTFPTSLGNITPVIQATSQTLGGTSVAGFYLDFTSTAGSKLGITNSDVALCQGVSQLGQTITGAMISVGATAGSGFSSGCACGGAAGAPTATASAGYILGNNSCTYPAGAAAVSGYCTGIPVNVCQPSGNNTPIQVFVPWQS